jgi:hypothetical protein
VQRDIDLILNKSCESAPSPSFSSWGFCVLGGDCVEEGERE